MTKKIWGALIVIAVLTAVFWKPEPQPLPKEKEVVAVAEPKPSTDDNALSAASTDLSVVLKRPAAKPVIKIGAVFPLSGDSAEKGTGFKNALLLARDDLKYQDPKYDYRFVIDDTQDIAAVYEKQKNADKVSAVITFGAVAGNFIAPQAEKDKIIHVNFGAVDNKIADGKYNFMNWTMPEKMIVSMLNFYKEHHYKNIVFIGAENPETHTLHEKLQELAAPDEIKITSFWLAPQEKDFLPLLTETKAVNADAYLLQIEKEQIAPFVADYKTAAIPAVLTNIETFSKLSDFKVIDGAYYTDVAHSMDIFNNRVKKAYPETNSNDALGTVYDTVMLLVQTFENASAPEQAVDILAQTEEYTGVVGVITQDKNGIFNARAVLKKVMNGEPVDMYEEPDHHH